MSATDFVANIGWGKPHYNPLVNQFTGSGMAQKQLQLRFRYQFHVARAARDPGPLHIAGRSLATLLRARR